jgi:sulfate/thiosulfate transport system substrate-binding protein
MILARRSMVFGWVGLAGVVVALLIAAGCNRSKDADVTVLNVSYDPTRELYKEYNDAFVRHWEETTGQTALIEQAHGGSGRQALKVAQGLEAAVVTLALAYDVDTIQREGLIAEGWQERLPNRSCPYTSTIVFLVRKGNPKEIRDWGDLVRSDVSVITPHPKTSGGARWNYLAAWGYALKRELGDLKKLHDPAQAEAVAKAQEQARQVVADVFKHVPILDPGARGSTLTFAKNGLGDVLLAWENEAFFSLKEFGADKFEIVSPGMSILAEPPVAVVDKVVDQQGNRAVAEAYLKYLYSVEGQTIAARNFYRPSNPKGVPDDLLKPFPQIELLTIDEVFGGWQKAQETHFNDGGVFDQIYKKTANQ